MNERERMAAAVKHSGKTQRNLSKIMGISEVYLGNILHCKTHPKKHLTNLAQILGVSLEWLTHGEGPEPSWLHEPKTEILPPEDTTGKKYQPSDQKRRETTTSKTRKPSALSPTNLFLAMADKFNTTMNNIAQLLAKNNEIHTKNNETQIAILQSVKETADRLQKIDLIHTTHEQRFKQIEEAIEKLSDDTLKAARKKTEEAKNDK